MMMTDSARDAWKYILERVNKDADNTHLRLAIKGGGCSGFMKKVEYCGSQDITEQDVVEEFDDVKVVVDGKSMLFLHDATIDYMDGLMGAGFIIDIPSSRNSCGCGDSFSM